MVHVSFCSQSLKGNEGSRRPGVDDGCKGREEPLLLGIVGGRRIGELIEAD